jgi:protease PrsW
MMNNPHDPRYATAATYLPGRPRDTAKRTLAIITALLVALVLGLIVLLLIGYNTGVVALMIGIVLAILPVPFTTTLVLWLDRYESEPTWLLVSTFLWGAFVSFIIAIVLNTAGGILVYETAGAEAANFATGSIFAPLVEETAKGLALFIIYFWKRHEFDGLLDGIVYATMVGLGFAMTENILYYARAANEGTHFILFIIRGGFSAYAHPLFTSMTGIGLGIASQSNKPLTKFVVPLLGFGMAIFLHSVWNTTLFLGGALGDPAVGCLAALTMYGIMGLLLLIVLATMIFALVREGRIVREHLYCDVQSGFLTPQEYNRLCSIPGRIGASFGALTGGGFSIWRARMQFHRAASDLAFHRRRAAAGLFEGDAEAAERERLYVQLIRELKARIGPH